MKRLFLSIAIALCIIGSANATDLLKSEYAYRRYTTQDGLPNLLLETAFQDSRGFLWIGTYKGFARFDGLKYTSFLAETATNILKLENGENGDVRAYTYHDVFMIDRNDSVRTINFTPQEIYLNTYNSRDLPNDYLILENENATEKYLVHFENDTIKELLRCAELNEIVGSKPFLDLKASKIYLPSLSGLNIFDLNTNKSVKIKGLTAECFLQHSELGLLAFDNDGIYQIVENIAKKLVSCRMSNDKRAAEISDGSIVVKDQKAIYRFRESNFELINQFNLSVVDLIRDNEGNVWVATHDGFYNFFHFDFINLQLEKDVVKFVQEDAHNNLWYGTIYGNLLHETDGKVSKILFPRQELKSFLFGSASVGKTLYFPRDNDILMYENSHFSWANLPYNIEDYDGYTKVLPYDKDKILILRGIGVYLCQKNGKIIHFYSDEELKQTDFQDIAIDSQGRWFACGHLGISAVNGDSVELFGNDNTAHTTSLCIDNQDNVWSASGNMLNLLHDDSITTVWQFPDDPVQAIYSVEKDYLLISTIHCVYFFNKTAFLQSGLCQFILFNQNNGFMGLNPQINGIFADSKGHFYLSCANMLVQFEPQNLLRKPLAPILNILSVKVSTDNIKWQNADLQSNIKLNHKNKNIKFSFIGLHFSAAENVRYHYRLIGFQNSWSEPTKQREVTFNNLPPGDYTFEIYADAGTDDSRSETVAYVFSIKPAFWQTAWFWAIVAIAFISLSFFISLTILQRKNRALLERLNTERELNDLRIRSVRLRAIPHFNFNVMGAIEYYVANRSKDEAVRLLNVYSRFMYETLRRVEDASNTLNDELEYVKMYLELEKIRYVDKFDFRIEVAKGVNSEVRLPNMILHTYCENAIKHGLSPRMNEGGNLLSIIVVQQDGRVSVSVEDNGVGRHYAQEHPNIRSSRTGLSILERQIEIYNRFNNNKITQSVDDLKQGTRFSVEVPVEYNYELRIEN